jgi:hypothetical protein
VRSPAGAPADAPARVTGAQAAFFSRSWAVLRHALPALTLYAGLRAVGLVLLYIWATIRGEDFAKTVGGRYDAIHYVGIAERGYDMGVRVQSDMVFFPLYPGLVAGTDPLLPGGARTAAIAVAWLAALAAAWGLFAIGVHLHSRTVGIMLAAVWAVVPHAHVETLAYTEGVFTALAAWSLYAVLTRRWLTAGLLCLLAGLTRPTAAALIPVVMLAALVAIIRREAGWRSWLALTIAPLGWLSYIGWVGLQTGQPDGWFIIQRVGWRQSWDGGIGTLRAAGAVLTQASELELYVVLATLVVAVGLFALTLIDRQPWPLLLYSALMLLAALGTASYLNSRARFLVPAFALLIPIAVGLGKTRLARRYVVLGVLTVLSSYFGCYLAFIWPYSP